MDYKSLVNQIGLLCRSKVSELFDDSLSEGKLGVLIFLFHYSRYANNREIYDDAYDLLQEIWCNLETDTHTLNFKYGIPGIAFGIDYLYRSNFLPQFDPSLLEELDSYILKRKAHQLDIINQDEFSFGQQIYFLNRFTYYLQLADFRYQRFLALALIQFVDDCQELVFSKTFISGIMFSLPFVSAFVYFIIEVYNVNISKEKASNIMHILFKRIVDQLPVSQIGRERNILYKLAEILRPFIHLIPDYYPRNKFLFDKPVNIDVRNLSKHSHGVVIPNSFCPPFIFYSSNVDKAVTHVNLDNMKLGLDGGIAGIGLGLIGLLEIEHKNNG